MVIFFNVSINNDVCMSNNAQKQACLCVDV